MQVGTINTRDYQWGRTTSEVPCHSHDIHVRNTVLSDRACTLRPYRPTCVKFPFFRLLKLQSAAKFSDCAVGALNLQVMEYIYK